MIEIARALPTIQFIMIGSPWDASILDQLMRERTPNLQYLGPVADRTKNSLIRKSSAGITTSKYEGFGWIPFEFLTAGKPVLAYPLDVFREIYGDLIIYVDDVSGFIRKLMELQQKAFRVKIDSGMVSQLKKRWNFTRAASRISAVLHLNSLVIFTRDYPENSSMILGCDVVNWKLWKSLSNSGIQTQIFANGTKYTVRSRLGGQTTIVGRRVAYLRRLRSLMNRSLGLDADCVRNGGGLNTIDNVAIKLLDFGFLLLEPIGYVYAYMKNRNKFHPQYIAASEPSSIFAALLIKRFYGVQVIGLVHDTDFYDNMSRLSIPKKAYNSIYVTCLRRVDRILAVSRETMKSLSRIYPDSERLILLWE
jgi:hypothetical protein